MTGSWAAGTVGRGCVLVVCCVLCGLVSGTVFGAGRDGPCGIVLASGHLGRICSTLGTIWARGQTLEKAGWPPRDWCMRRSCGGKFPAGLMLHRKKLAEHQKKLACGEKQNMDLLFIDVAGKCKRMTWLFTDVC